MVVNTLGVAKQRSQAPADKPGIVGSAVAVLRLLASRSEPVGVNTIARDLSMPPSSCFKILKQLQRSDFVDFDERTKCYSLGVGVIDLARRALDPLRAFSIVRPRLEAIADRRAAAVGFWRRTSGSRIVLAGFVEGSSPLRIHMSVGQRLPMLMGAVGRAIAARLQLSDEELRREFARLRWQSPPAFEQYMAEVRQVRERGFAVDRDNFASGVTSVAVAVHDYGMSGILLSGQCAEGFIEAIGTELVEVANWASSRLGDGGGS
jgi:DNA-binding IclR family transcriptional regulator